MNRKLTEQEINDLRAEAIDTGNVITPATSEAIESLCREVLDLRAEVDRMNQRSSKL